MNYIKKHLIQIALGLVIFYTGLTIFLFWYNDFINTDYYLSPEKMSDFGSFISGTLGTIFTLITTFLVYKTYNSQKQEFENQSNIIKQQQFESTFFNMLNAHNELKKNLSTENKIFLFSREQIDNLLKNEIDKNDIFKKGIDNRKKKGTNVFKNVSYDLNALFNTNLINATINYYNKPGLKDLDYIAPILKDLEEHKKIIDKEEDVINQTLEENGIRNKSDKFDLLNNSLKFVFEYYENDIGHYCNNVYYILRFIKENEDASKKSNKNYSDTFQSQLNINEQLILFYNLYYKNNLSEHDYSSIKLVEHFNFLENIGLKNLIKENHKEIYPNLNLK